MTRNTIRAKITAAMIANGMESPSTRGMLLLEASAMVFPGEEEEEGEGEEEGEEVTGVSVVGWVKSTSTMVASLQLPNALVETDRICMHYTKMNTPFFAYDEPPNLNLLGGFARFPRVALFRKIKSRVGLIYMVPD